MSYSDWDNLPPGVTPRDIDEAAGALDEEDETCDSERWCDECGLELWPDEEALCADCARWQSSRGGDGCVERKDYSARFAE